jgi:hypothetical protein
MKTRYRILRWVMGLAVAALSAWLLARDLDRRAVLSALGRADYRWVAAGAAAIVTAFFTRARRWQVLLGQARVRFRPALTGLLVGQAANMLLPVRSGDVARAAWIAPERETGAGAALGSVAAEKVWDLLALLVCGLVLLLWIDLPGWFARSTGATALALAAVGTILWAGLHWQETLLRWAGQLLAWFPVGWDAALLDRLRQVAGGLESLRRPSLAVRALGWTGLTWLLGTLANLAVLRAFGIPSPAAALLLGVALMAGGSVPVPARLGLFEGICVVCLALFGVPRDLGLAVGLVLHGVVMGPPLVGAALLALWPARDEPA